MKMNYLLDKKSVYTNRPRKTDRFRPVLLVLLFVVLYGFGSLIWPPVSRPVLFLAGPLFSINGEARQAVIGTAQFFQSKKTLVSTNQALRQELREVKARAFLAEQKLNQLAVFSLHQTASPEAVVGQVVARPRFLPYDIFLLTLPAGGGETVRLNDKVTWQGRILLGEVVQLAGDNARVKLYSSPGIRRLALVGPDKIQAVLVGRGGGNFTIDLPRGLDIPVGSVVYHALNPSLILGLVGEVVKQPENPSQVIHVRTPVNIYTLKWLEISSF
ncbi:MAG: hypothetical protein WDZ85_03595 [Candidatus Paceibacterota bacterium]